MNKCFFSFHFAHSIRIWHHGIAVAVNPWKFWKFPDPAVLHRSTHRLLRRPSKSRPDSSLPSLSFMTALLLYSNRTNGPAVSFHSTVIANLSPFDADTQTLGSSPWVGRAQERERKNERTKERKNERTKERKNERTKERKNERTKERKNERTKERKNERTKE
jgi:hypothetical protein